MKKSFQKTVEKRLGTELEGTLIATFGATADIEDAQGKLIRCHIRKNLESLATGDRVLWIPQQENSGIIVGLLPRKSLLCRPENMRKPKLIAANLDAIIIVIAPNTLSEEMIDHYLIAAETLKIQPIILLNKIDLLTEQSQTEIEERLSIYKKIGYQVLSSSIYIKNGLTTLADFLKDKTCVLVGSSGVGKSSIIANLNQDSTIRIGENNVSTGLGKHTTTITRLYHLSSGGNLIDSPGVREFGLWQISKEDVLRGFIEFNKFLNQCKFRDCNHLKEPGCAIQKAVLDKHIAEKRFVNYKKIIAKLSENNIL